MTLPLFLLIGVAVGGWHFGSLRWLCTQLVGSQGGAWRRLVALHLLRICVLVVACAWAARSGALALAALGAGLMCARVVLVRRALATRLPLPPAP